VNVECNNKMVHNEEELIAGSLKIGASERICTVLCQGANMLASGVGPFTSRELTTPYFPQYLNNQLQETLLHVRMDQLDANSSIGILFWQLECRIHPQLLGRGRGPAKIMYPIVELDCNCSYFHTRLPVARMTYLL
jgi:hypothetical protein